MQSIFPQGYKGKSDSIFSGKAGSVLRSIGVDARSEPGKIKVQQALEKVSGGVVDDLATSGARTSDGKNVWFAKDKVFVDNEGVFEKKLELSRLDRDIMFSQPTYQALNTSSSTVRLSEDGTKVYVLSVPLSRIEQYTLLAPYAITTAGEREHRFVVNGAVSLWVAKNKLFVLHRSKVEVYKIDQFDIGDRQLIDEWDLSSHTTTAQDIYFREDGEAFWIQQTDGHILEFSLPSPFGGDFQGLRLLLTAGGGGGSDVGSSGSDVRYAGGAGGAGGSYEWFGLPFQVGVTQNIEVGEGGLRAYGGNNGGDTKFGDLGVPGGGHGGETNFDYPPYDSNRGGDGGSGGNGGVAWDEGSALPEDRSRGPGGKAVRGGGSVELSGFDGREALTGDLAVAGVGAELQSDISGTPYTYSAGAPETPANNAGAHGVTYGQGGGGGSSRNGGSARQGGSGYQGVAIVRFRTADITYTQTGGAVTAVGDETVITWTGSGTFTVDTVNSASPSHEETYTNLPVASAFAVEEDRVLLTSELGVEQYVMDGYDIATAVRHENSLFTPEGYVLGGLFLSEDYLFTGFETGFQTNLDNIGRYEFIESEVNILSAQVFQVEFEKEGEKQLKYDSVGLTSLRHPSTFPVEHSDSNVTISGFETTGDISTPRGGSPSNEKTDFVLITGAFQDSLDLRAKIVSKGSTSFVVNPSITAVAPYYTYNYSEVKQDAPAFFNANTAKYRQPLIFLEDTKLDKIEIKLREGRGLDGGYDVRLRVIDVTDPNSEVIEIDETRAIAPGDVGTNETMYPFEFTLTTLRSGVKYALELELLDHASHGLNLRNQRYLVAPGATTTQEEAIETQQVGNTGLRFQLKMYDTTVEETEGSETEERIYFATEKMLFYVKAEDVTGDWTGKIVPVGAFVNGHKEFHPMAKQNLSLFIGDGKVVAEVTTDGRFIRETQLNVENGEVIQALKGYDVDLLIGTSLDNYGRILRWDTQSESWVAEDEVFEKGGVTAFLPDDDYIYVFAGKKATMYFYNGEKNILTERVYGISRAEAVVGHNSVGFINNVPLFGLTGLQGEPVEQGVYGFGRYSPGYETILTLDFPVPSGEFFDVSIGAIITDGDEMWVAWQDEEDVGVAKLSHTKKYGKAFFETGALANYQNRHELKTLSDVMVPYYSLPADTAITIGLKIAYENDYRNMDVVNDELRKIVYLKSPTARTVANPQIRVGFTVKDNNAPEIEDLLFKYAGDRSNPK